MGTVSLFPAAGMRTWNKYKNIVEERILVMGHDLVLAEIIRTAVKEEFENYAEMPEFNTSITLSNSEDAQKINKLMIELRLNYKEYMAKMAWRIIKLRIELCEEIYSSKSP